MGKKIEIVSVDKENHAEHVHVEHPSRKALSPDHA